MKKALFTLLFVALSAMTFAQRWTSIGSNAPVGPEVRLVSSSEQQVVVDFTLGGFNMTRVETPNGTQMLVSVPKMAATLEAGVPDLPQFPIPAIIGDRAEMKVNVSKSEYTDYENVEIVPSKGNISRQVDPETVPYTYGEMYSQNAFYPAAQAHLEAPYILRDFRGQNIMVTPFAYNPVTKTLRVYHHMTIEMNKVSNNGVNQKVARRSAAKVSPEMKATYEHRFINYTDNRYNFVTDRGEMLVICPEQYMEAMQPFVDWKNQSGRPTTMVSVSEVGGNNDNAIKSYITNLYNDPSHNLVYVLFVGDYNHITPHSVSGERSDNWFGQIEGNDRYEEVLIGRFSVQTDAHVANHVNKVLYYERDMNDENPMKASNEFTWVNKGLGIGAIGAGSGHYGEDDYVHIDYIRDTLEHYTYEHVTELHQGAGATAPAISAVIDEGVSIINYCNHGSEVGWGVANYSTSHVNALVNDYKWPFIWSVACLCGKFDYGGPNGECFAEAWMRATNNTTGAPTGAVGGMFSWMSQPWIPPMYGQDEMVDILTEWHNSDKFNHTFGGASLNGNFYVIDMSGSQGYDTHDTWILFGDPSLMVRTDNPVSMNLSYSPSVLMLGMTELEVNAVDTQYGIATLTMNGEVIASGNLVNGSCTLSFPAMTNVGNATLTVMGYNKLTEVINIEVLPAEGPYLTIAGYDPNFSAVNVATNLSMSFKNVGVDPTHGTTTVTLSCADQRLSLINNTATFDVLNADETTSLSNAFSFIVEEGVADGTRFQIDVEMNDGTESWIGKAFITAGQAILGYYGTDWAEGYMPGENATFAAKFQNTGHYLAKNAVVTISCDSPYVTLLNNQVEVGTIDPEGIASSVFEVSIDPDCPGSSQIPFTFTMTADGGLSAEGTFVMMNFCQVTFELRDSYGDGWNGASLTVRFDDGTPDVELTCEGYSATSVLTIGNGTHVTLIWNRGSYDSECSFTVKYDNGDQIYQGSNLQPGTVFEFDCACDVTPVTGSVGSVENLTYTVEAESIILNWDMALFANDYTVIRNGVVIGTTDETTYTDPVAHEGDYTYCVIANYNNGSSLPECVVIDAEWGIDENGAEFSIYPNPVSGTLYVECGNAEFNYEMYNGMGQRVASGNARGTEQISVDGLTQGVYFLRLTCGAQTRVEKVVVK